MFRLFLSFFVASAMAFNPIGRMTARGMSMAATMDVSTESILATAARDARGLAIDSISAVSYLKSQSFKFSDSCPVFSYV